MKLRMKKRKCKKQRAATDQKEVIVTPKSNLAHLPHPSQPRSKLELALPGLPESSLRQTERRSSRWFRGTYKHEAPLLLSNTFNDKLDVEHYGCFKAKLYQVQ